MKNAAFYLLFGIFFSTVATAQVEATFNFSDEGQRVCLVDATVTKSPATVTLHFRNIVD